MDSISSGFCGEFEQTTLLLYSVWYANNVDVDCLFPGLLRSLAQSNHLLT